MPPQPPPPTQRPMRLVLLSVAAVIAAGVVAIVVILSGAASSGPSQQSPSVSATKLAGKAEYVLAVVDATGQAPKGYVGGRQFLNDGRGGTAALPRKDAQGKAITYHEYDVNPYQQGVNRGPERLVIGSDGSAFYTGDHYVTWVRLR